MVPNTIASEPIHGWRLKSNHSKVALEWLHWMDHCLRESLDHQGVEPVGFPIWHAGNQGEYHIPNSRYTVDGYNVQTNTIYEFQGCFWHGCPACYPNYGESHRHLEDRTPEEVYRCTQKKLHFLRHKGYNVVEIWECQWHHLKKERGDVSEFVDSLEFFDPLEPRDAFCGGRTNAVKLYHLIDVDSDKKMKYYDFTSLYTWVNKNGKYPVGHPEIISQPNTADISEFFGLAKCTVLPPEKLYHPVLPLRQNGKLTFPLCDTCVEDEMTKPMLERSHICNHTNQQRRITGMWCIPELEKPVEKGYTILKIHKVWHFPKTEVGLFSNYVNTWRKIKEEAGG